MCSLYSPVVVDHSVQAVRDREHCRVREVEPNGALDSLVSLGVHSRRGLVENEHAAPAQQSASQTHQLPLADR